MMSTTKLGQMAVYIYNVPCIFYVNNFDIAY